MMATRNVFFWILIAFVLLMACSTRHEQSTAKAPVVLSDSALNSAADSLFAMALTLAAGGNMDSALSTHEQALNLRLRRKTSDVRLAYSYWKTGLVLHRQMKSEAANTNFDRAVTLAGDFDVPVDTMILIYQHAARAKAQMKDYASSISLARYAERLARTERPDDKVLRLNCMITLAIVYAESEQHEEALDVSRQALKLIEPAKHQEPLAATYFNMAMSTWALERFDSCLFFLDRTLEIWMKIPRRSIRVSAVYLNKGDIFKRMGKFDSAHFYTARSLKMRQAQYGEKHIWTAGAYEAMGDLYHDMGMYDSALVYRQAQLRSLIKSFNDPRGDANPKPSQEEVSLDLVDYMIDKASTLRLSSERNTHSVETLDLSLTAYLLADSIYSAFQGNLPYDDLKLNVLSTQPIPYSDMLDVTFQLYNATRERRFLDHALNIMERSKASVLKSALRRIESSEKIGLRPELLARERQLLQRRSNLVQLLANEGYTEQTRDSLSGAVMRVDQEYDKLKVVIAGEQPNYLLLRFGGDADLDRLTDAMKLNNGLWVEYFWGREKLYVLSVGPAMTRLREVAITRELLANLDSVSSGINHFDERSVTKASFRSFTDGAYWLFDRLLAPALQDQDVAQLIICPSGPLSSFPFEALITSRPAGDEVNFQLNYVVNDYDVSYQYSSSFMERQSGRKRHGNKLLAVGHAAAEEGGDVLNDLPGARIEIDVIRQTMNNSSNSYLLQAEASELAFKENAERFNLLHLAIHGVADTINAMESHLVFRGPGGPAEDGKLYAHELYTLNLQNADLAVLSACESGVGRLHAGEGMMSIARGFAYAGCPSLVISVWKISDKSSPLIMSDFYSGLSQGEPINVALANAKKKYLIRANSVTSHPSFWAAFLAVGNTAPLEQPVRPTTIFLAILLVAGLVLLVWIVLKKRASRLQLQRG